LEARRVADTLAAAMKLHLSLQLLGLLLGLFLPSACSSPKGSSKDAASGDPRANRSEPISDEDWNKLKPARPHGEPQAVHFTDSRSQRRLALVNESHTDPSEQYSQRRKAEDAMTKVGHDEVVAALLERFEEHGFFKLAESGPAPSAGAGTWNMTLEVERKDGLRHMALGAASTSAQRECFTLCRTDFVQLYSSILGLQAVERVPDWQSGTPVPPKH
jgi:hypothetical protein